MNSPLKRWAIPGLRWALGLVVLAESLDFMFSASAAHHLARMGLPLWLGPTLGAAEGVAAVLFLLPATLVAGGYLLLVIFVAAMLIHIVHGQHDFGGLLVYATAVLVCLAHRQAGRKAVSDG